MTPINFPESNCNVRGDSLFVLTTNGYKWPVGNCNLQVHNGNGQFISKWKMSWRERLHALVHGTCWLQMHCYSFPPVSLTAADTIFTDSEKENNQ